MEEQRALKLWREFLVGFVVPVGIGCALAAAFILVMGCGDGPDLVDVAKRQAPAREAPGCDPVPAPVDAGPEVGANCLELGPGQIGCLE